MLFVHEKERGYGKWEVAWMWMPHFLAADSALHKYVDKEMTKAFKGTDLGIEFDPMDVQERMHAKVIELVLEKYPMQGLREYLEAIQSVKPEKETADGVATKD